MAQLQLVFSRGDSQATRLSQIPCRMLSIGSCRSLGNFTSKLDRLREQNPGAFRAIERAVDHLLNEEDR